MRAVVLVVAAALVVAAGAIIYVYQQPGGAGGGSTRPVTTTIRPPLEPIDADSPAARLARLINRGDPVDVRNHLTPAELDAALGKRKEQ